MQVIQPYVDAYIENGFTLIPLKSMEEHDREDIINPTKTEEDKKARDKARGKTPAICGWQKLTHADNIKNKTLINDKSGIGLLTGNEGNFTVIDIDKPKDGEIDGKIILNQLIIPELIQETKDNPTIYYPIVRTGSRGLHIYIRCYGKDKLRATNRGIKCMKDGKIVKCSIDIKNDGGYVVAPPSLHRSGERYKFEYIICNGELKQGTDKAILQIIGKTKSVNFGPLSDSLLSFLNQYSYYDLDKKEYSDFPKREIKKYNTDGVESVDLKMIEKLLSLLSQETCDDYDRWKRVGIALANCELDTGIDCLSLYHSWSSKSPKYNERQATDIYNSILNKESSDAKCTIGTIMYYAKEDNREEWGKFIADLRPSEVDLDKIISDEDRLKMLPDIEDEKKKSKLKEDIKKLDENILMKEEELKTTSEDKIQEIKNEINNLNEEKKKLILSLQQVEVKIKENIELEKRIKDEEWIYDHCKLFRGKTLPEKVLVSYFKKVVHVVSNGGSQVIFTRIMEKDSISFKTLDGPKKLFVGDSESTIYITVKFDKKKTILVNKRFQEVDGEHTQTIRGWYLNYITYCEYAGVRFHPFHNPEDDNTPKHGIHRVFNRFPGYPIQFDKDYKVNTDNIKTVLDHVNILANNDKNGANFIEKYIAHMLQKPLDKSGVVLLFKSVQGAGKNSWFGSFGEYIMGNSLYLHCPNIKNLLQKHNTITQGRLFTILDECSFPTGSQADLLKARFSEKSIIVEPKGVNSYTYEDYSRFVLFTNPKDASAVARLESKDRRYACFDMSEEKVKDREYFNKLVHEFKTYKKDIFHYFMNVDISTFNPRDLPQTELRNKLISSNISSTYQFLIDLGNGVIPNASDYEITDKDTYLSSYGLYDLYVKYCTDSKVFSQKSRIAFLQDINFLGYESKGKRIDGKNINRILINKQGLEEVLRTKILCDPKWKFEKYEDEQQPGNNQTSHVHISDIYKLMEQNISSIDTETKSKLIQLIQSTIIKKEIISGAQDQSQG